MSLIDKIKTKTRNLAGALALAGAVSASTGCGAFGYKLTQNFDSEPRGARVYFQQQCIGTTPFKLELGYLKSDSFGKTEAVGNLIFLREGYLKKEVQYFINVPDKSNFSFRGNPFLGNMRNECDVYLLVELERESATNQPERLVIEQKVEPKEQKPEPPIARDENRNDTDENPKDTEGSLMFKELFK